MFISSSASCLPWRELAWDPVGLGRGSGAVELHLQQAAGTAALCPWAGSAVPQAAVGAHPEG